jgi:hypothetical protein
VLSVAAALGSHVRRALLLHNAVSIVAAAWTQSSCARARSLTTAANTAAITAAAAAAGSAGGAAASTAGVSAAAAGSTAAVTKAAVQTVADNELVSEVAVLLAALVEEAPLTAPITKTACNAETDSSSSSSVLSAAAVAALCDSELLVRAVQTAPAAAAVLAARLSWAQPVDSPVATHVMTALEDVAVAAVAAAGRSTSSSSSTAAAVPDCAQLFKPCLDVLSALLHMRDGLEAARTEAALHWLVPCIDALARNSSSSSSTSTAAAVPASAPSRLTRSEANVLQSVCRLLLSVHAHVQPAAAVLEAQRSMWEQWAKWAAAAVATNVRSSSSSGSTTGRIASRLGFR